MVSPDSCRVSRAPHYSGIVHNRPVGFVYRTSTLYRSPFNEIRLPPGIVTVGQVLHPDKNDPTTPTTHRCKAIACNRFRLFPFRSPLLGESHSLSSPPLNEMFQFSGLPLPALYIQARVLRHDSQWVSPFGYLRIIACKRLPEAFRCLLRPSSAPCAKASTVRPF